MRKHLKIREMPMKVGISRFHFPSRGIVQLSPWRKRTGKKMQWIT
jgi:hypothetical protein